MVLLQNKTFVETQDCKEMKISFLIQDNTTIGGTERTTCCLANQMARQGHQVSIVSIFGVNGRCAFDLEDSVKFEILSDVRYGLKMSALRRGFEMVKVVRKVKKSQLLRDADVIIAQKFFAAIAAVSARYRAKLIVGDHFPYAKYKQPVRWLRDRIYGMAKTVVVLTSDYKKQFQAAGIENVVVIPNMISIKEVQHEEKSREIIAVGRLAEEKGFDTLITAFAKVADRLDDWKLKIYGGGDKMPQLKNQIDAVEMTGKIETMGEVSDIEAVYANAAFGVMPSRFEGFPMVLLEAAAAGLPMVAFDCPTGPREILGLGGGLLVENQNVEVLAGAIVKMAGDAELREKLSAETSVIRETYSPEKICRQWEIVINQTFNGRD